MKLLSPSEKLPEIGSEVGVNIKSFKDNLSEEERKEIMNNPKGNIIDYKLTDGLGIGFVVRLTDGKVKWFFRNEIIINKEKEIYTDNEDLFILKKDTYLDTSKDLSYLLNPLNFAKWLIYSTKDIL